MSLVPALAASHETLRAITALFGRCSPPAQRVAAGRQLCTRSSRFRGACPPSAAEQCAPDGCHALYCHRACCFCPSHGPAKGFQAAICGAGGTFMIKKRLPYCLMLLCGNHLLLGSAVQASRSSSEAGWTSSGLMSSSFTGCQLAAILTYQQTPVFKLTHGVPRQVRVEVQTSGALAFPLTIEAHALNEANHAQAPHWLPDPANAEVESRSQTRTVQASLVPYVLMPFPSPACLRKRKA